ncbi:MAG: hypothetical protein CSYNP_00653 [Syntrophus sp. SKADARSKE-3]|nr:hypothetical protein [Syntrophus sp. SKADARSKE-3]
MSFDHFPHLCQPDACKSCGACCGLYNYADSTRESLAIRLRNRTAHFADADKSPEGLNIFSEKIRSMEDGAKRYEVIYCCEYLGFLDETEKRVGCLLHPFQNNGADLRGVSFYGQELCDGHFCPSYYYIAKEEKLALLHILDDWYLYGLVITDIDLAKAYFKLISDSIYEMPSPDLFESSPFKGLALGFMSMKLNWPFRSPDIHRFGKYYFDGSQYMIHFIDYEALGCERSPFDKIFLSLSTEFKDKREVLAAEGIIQGHIDAFVQAYQSRQG